jgi:hypothetical protein
MPNTSLRCRECEDGTVLFGVDADVSGTPFEGLLA